MIASNLPRVIGLTGYKQSGKDTTCSVIQQHFPAYKRVAFADAVRKESQDILDGAAEIPGDAPPELQALYSKQIAENWTLRTYGLEPITVYERPYTARIRAILQQHGTEYRRAQDADYWVKAWERDTDGLNAVIIPDLRFPNEERMIREKGGVIWRVWRGDPVVEDLHESEQHIPHIRVDAVVNNTGSLVDLGVYVDLALEVMRKTWRAAA